ncbi:MULTISPECIES: hypothetical protein [Cronobacter]|uniref:hypothetical protein n=1 Tax=Cronobacter TaxID=413496 RepID=UPI0024C315EF|nr:MULTISPECIES: hypothetical protein [Cronobacter]MDK1186937.1 hypothetical protein [Cronobacter turicensis]MDK1191339.1 hypothetical protein [Cronobacter dublinensis]MDK1201978.1 hypothetical protein [Cronobacter dublinensis]MDK1207829.1 hypothetical protein [Cronobacter turicensis]MDK1216752.1 hypothetical protein [Cronobacter turicensis]
MPVQDVIPSYEQMYLLNQQLICNADQFKYAVITVGGQAVQYWISYYHAQYGDRLPDERLVTSADCDYSARKDDIAIIAKTLNVKTWQNKDFQPPSLAKFMLIDQDTHDIKQDGGRIFANPNAPDEANTVDIIDRPGGFERSDFLGDKLYLHTTPFYVEATGLGMPEMSEKVRVLNPIACMRSRFSNLINLRRDPEIEIARINALKIPCYFFLIEQFDVEPFRIARAMFMELWRLAVNENCLRQQAFWHTWQGPLLERQQSNNITLLDVLERVHQYLKEHHDDFDIPKDFLTKDLPLKLAKLRDRFKRYIELNNEQAVRGRRGYERNRSDD